MDRKKPSTDNNQPSEKQPKGKSEHTRTAKSTEKEIGGFEDSGLKEPTRFGDWEVKGRCSDF